MKIFDTMQAVLRSKTIWASQWNSYAILRDRLAGKEETMHILKF